MFILRVSVDCELSVMPQLHHAHSQPAFIQQEGQKDRLQTERVRERERKRQLGWCAGKKGRERRRAIGRPSL